MSHINTQRPICEGSEPEASPDHISMAVTDGGAAAAPAASQASLRQPVPGEGTAVPANTCCGGHLSAPHTVGPFIKFWGLERESAPPAVAAEGAAVAAAVGPPSVWKGSLLLVTRAPRSEVVVELQDGAGSRHQVLEGEELDSFGGWVALRYRLRIPVGDQETKVRYAVSVSGQALRPHSGSGSGGAEEGFNFYVAGKSQPTHWGFYSCSGFTPDVPPGYRESKWGGVTPLWEDVRAVHDENPLHLLVGGGDQLYCDDVWSLPSLRRFLDLPNDSEEQRLAKCRAKYGSDMAAEVEAYYFHHYAHHFSIHPIGDVYALVPQVMSWDDHDIFDGWGSYPAYLQQSTVFAGVFGAALRWYCVFQQHCRPAEKPPVAVYEVGSRTAIVACDMRHQRRPDEIVPLEHYMKISMLCTQLPKGIDHVVFVSTVPVVYPHVPGSRVVLNLLKNGLLQCLLGSLGAQQLNQFREPELLDDLDDHWSAPNHREERRFLIEHLQMLSKYRGCRVTLLSGDVHVAGAGRLVSSPAPPSEAALRNDFRYMPQVISSAIGNAPPPGGLVKMLKCFGRGGRINENTKHRMVPLIKSHLHVGVGTPLENKRNWCEVLEQPASQGGSLTFRIRIEDTPGSVKSIKKYDIEVPPLEPLTPGTVEYYVARK